MSVDNNTRFGSLDGIRFLAFLLVFVAHSFKHLISQIHIENKFLMAVYKAFFMAGSQGVLIFFVLSGFLITYLLLREVEQFGRVNLPYFYVRRALRIWPLFYATVVFALFVYPFFVSKIGIEHVQNGNVLMNLLFLNNFDLMNLAINGDVGFNPHLQITWSVAIEEQYYLVWPLFFLIFPIRLFKFIVFPLLFLITFTFSIYHYSDNGVLYFHTLSVMGALITGGLAAYLSSSYSKFRDFFQCLSNVHRLCIYVVGILLFAIRGIMVGYFDSLFIPTQILILFYTFFILDQSLNLNGALKFNPKSWFSKMGVYTYGLYLLHPLPILFIQHVLDYAGLNYKKQIPAAIILGVTSFPLTLLLAYLSYTYFESPFLKLKDKFYQKPLKSGPG